MIIQGDCLLKMREMDDNSIDFVVTDPPYGLNFMGKKWDKEIPNSDIWKEALRVCKPGAMLAAFGGSRTHHHLMIALEQAGWEIRDVIMWIYGSGFPKSHNFGKRLRGIWEPYGTSLKPAYEPIILAMKPLDGTFAENAQTWGVAGINIESSRIGTDNTQAPTYRMTSKEISGGGFARWPANVILDEEAGEDLDKMSGIGASRFFYCAKASPHERNRGLDGMPIVKSSKIGEFKENPGRKAPKSSYGKQNFHPTVKPLSLMKYILTLLAPPGDPIVLDPFAGSGTTLLAAKELGIRAMGIELETEYCEIAKNRIA